jgi:hypothetical protein
MLCLSAYICPTRLRFALLKLLSLISITRLLETSRPTLKYDDGIFSSENSTVSFGTPYFHDK